jgi:[FeFe] hydrogenase (group B1/B3)
MKYIENQTALIRHNIKKEIARLFIDGKLIQDINRVPISLIPHDSASYRCCIYKDRELIKKRTIAALGFSLEDDINIEHTLLSDYAALAVEREEPTFPILTFLDEACRSCVRANYFVTNVCQHCVARPCIMNCPKDAISMKDQAFIHPEKCINCGICQKVCPYHAIVYIPVPCEEACPVGAISKDQNGRQEIDYAKCIFCGRCARACPFGAVLEKSQIIDVLKHIKNGRQVIAMIAPAIVGQYNATLDQIAGAIKAVGFSNVVEVALGADKTTELEAEEFVERMKQGDPIMGTSCCPAYVEAVRKHAKAFLPYVSHTKTPMAYTAEQVRETFPDSVRVFIGPCIAKKHEGLANPDVDYVMTFEALDALFGACEIDVESFPGGTKLDLQEASSTGRGFPVSRGVANAVISKVPSYIKITPVLIDGLTRQNVKLLNAYAKKCPGNMVEVMSCEGGCVNGPGVVNSPVKAKQRVEEFIK